MTRKFEYKLFCLPEQERAWMAGYNVYHGLAGQRVLGDVALEQCLAEQGQLPRQWQKYELCFWGSVLQTGRDRLGIRTMYWNNVAWTAGLRFTDSFFTRHQPAMIVDEYP